MGVYENKGPPNFDPPTSNSLFIRIPLLRYPEYRRKCTHMVSFLNYGPFLSKRGRLNEGPPKWTIFLRSNQILHPEC